MENNRFSTFKIIFVVICSVLFLYQISLLAIDYQQGKTFASFQLKTSPQSGPLPAITVCLPWTFYSIKGAKEYFLDEIKSYSENKSKEEDDYEFGQFFSELISSKHSIRAYDMMTKLSVREEKEEIKGEE